MWGYSGVTVDARFESIPENYPEGTIAYGWPGTLEGAWTQSSPWGLCFIRVDPDLWAAIPDSSRVILITHELGHCWGLNHGNDLSSVMSMGLKITRQNWLDLKSFRSSLSYKLTAPLISVGGLIDRTRVPRL